MTLHSSLTREELDTAMVDLLDHLEERARETLMTLGGNDTTALAHAHQFLVFTELINSYGSALIAFDDIEDETLPN